MNQGQNSPGAGQDDAPSRLQRLLPLLLLAGVIFLFARALWQMAGIQDPGQLIFFYASETEADQLRELFKPASWINPDIVQSEYFTGEVFFRPGQQIEADTESVQSFLQGLAANRLSVTGKKHYIRLPGSQGEDAKYLRAGIEEAVPAGERAQVLRSVIPVYQGGGSGGDACRSIYDAALYAGDNFGGVGIMAGSGSIETLAGCEGLFRTREPVSPMDYLALKLAHSS